jgi:hypothetical protein
MVGEIRARSDQRRTRAVAHDAPAIAARNLAARVAGGMVDDALLRPPGLLSPISQG